MTAIPRRYDEPTPLERLVMDCIEMIKNGSAQGKPACSAVQADGDKIEICLSNRK